jgi:NAD(P)-dependent dehydrogenase (short-subunit alcohol dehydrogenase family)
MRRLVQEAFTSLGRIDVVVSHAGYGLFGAAEDLTDAQVEAMIATNLTASIQLARTVVLHLRAQGGGRLLQLSSIGWHIAFPAFVHDALTARLAAAAGASKTSRPPPTSTAGSRPPPEAAGWYGLSGRF